jgi:hypothetical protein
MRCWASLLLLFDSFFGIVYMYDTLLCTMFFLLFFKHSGAWIGAPVNHGKRKNI